MPLKVLVTGPFSTGKSTVVAGLADGLTAGRIGVAVLPDAARNCPLPLNERQTEEASLWLIATQIANEIEACSRELEVVLCDRGIPDIVAHHEEAGGLKPSVHFAAIVPFLIEWCGTYDLILASTIDDSLPVVGDGLRVVSEEYRRKLGQRSEQVLTRVGNVLTMPLGQTERVRYALAVIADRLNSLAAGS